MAARAPALAESLLDGAPQKGKADETPTEGRCACLKACGFMPSMASRIAYLDNLKGLFVFFLVGCHVFCGVRVVASFHGGLLGRLGAWLMMMCFVVTLPGFAFITGFLSKHQLDKKQWLGIVRFFVAWLIQKLLTFPLESMEWDGKLPLPLFATFGGEWYLLCVVLWRSFLPPFASLRYPIAISAASSVVTTFLDVSNVSSMQVVFTFLPFFLAGFHTKRLDPKLQQYREWWHKRRFVSLTWVSLACAATAATVFIPAFFTLVYDFVNFTFFCFYGGSERDMSSWLDSHPDSSFFDLPKTVPEATYCRTPTGVVRMLGLYAVQVFHLLGLFAFMPDRPLPVVAKAGEISLYIYLAHAWFIVPFFPWLAKSDSNLGGFAITFGLFAFLSSGVIVYVLRPCVEPRVECCMAVDLESSK